MHLKFPVLIFTSYNKVLVLLPSLTCFFFTWIWSCINITALVSVPVSSINACWKTEWMNEWMNTERAQHKEMSLLFPKSKGKRKNNYHTLCFKRVGLNLSWIFNLGYIFTSEQHLTVVELLRYKWIRGRVMLIFYINLAGPHCPDIWSRVFLMSLTFTSVDYEQRRLPSTVWVGVIQSDEDLNRTISDLPWARGNSANSPLGL